jgi:hypothetical protein
LQTTENLFPAPLTPIPANCFKSGTAKVHLYDGRTNEKLWQFQGLLTANLGSTIDQTIRSVGSMVANELPYF